MMIYLRFSAGSVEPVATTFPSMLLFGHTKPRELECWRIYLALLKGVQEKRLLNVSWLEAARPGKHSGGIFELRFEQQYSIACESLSRPNNFRLVSEVLSEITGIKTESRYSIVKHS
jgi:hypothetical protein